MCYLGTPAAPKIPGQATEHCEHTHSALDFVTKEEDLELLRAYRSSGEPLVDNVFRDFQKATSKFFAFNTTEKGADPESEIKKLLGKDEGKEFVDK